MPDQVLTDPLGCRITLHQRTWYGHIVKGHPDMKPFRGQACRAVTRPLQIRKSLSDEDCRLYFGRGPHRRLMILVVADVSEGFVKTAHLVSRFTGGPIEWSKPTR